MQVLIGLCVLAVPVAGIWLLAPRHGDKRSVAERIVCVLFALSHWQFQIACAADKALVEYRRQAQDEGPRPECLESR